MKDSDPAAIQMFMEGAKQHLNLSPGLGFKDDTYPIAGVERERRRKAAQGATASERMNALMQAGVTDHAGMRDVFERLYTSPEKAFMLSRGGR